MFVRLVLTAALALNGAALGALHDSAPERRDVAVVGASDTADPTDPTGSTDVAGPADVTFTELDVVVPPVEAGGTIVDSPELRAAQADDEVIVADEVVAADRVESAVVETEDFQTLGVTWPGAEDGSQLGVEVRTRSEDTWTEWAPLEVGDAAPDAGTADASQAVRGGTESVWVGAADAVQLSFAATPEVAPDDLRLALIGSDVAATATEPGESDGEVEVAPSRAVAGAEFSSAVSRTSARSSVAVAGATTTGLAAAAAPPIISRAEWGARPQVCAPDVASGLVGAVVHHTAGGNNYSTVASAMDQIRNDQAYHIDGRGWCDIGYNFIVDKWGNIYEGRANSLTQPVIGVHAGGFNTGTVGVSMLGNYTDINPSAATQQAVGQVIGWRLGAYGINPQGTMSYSTGSGENSKFQNTTVSLPRVFGHRDVAYTNCPGLSANGQVGGYLALPVIRAMAATVSSAGQYAESVAMVKAMYSDMLGRLPDGPGLASWVSALLSGASPGQVVNAISTSREYVERRVVEGYNEILGRGPDPTGMVSWTDAIMSGRLRAEDLRGQLIASAEYYGISGGTDERYVTRLYQDILGRGAGAAEIAFWVTGIQTRGRVAAPYGVWRSLESAHLRVHEIYGVFLGRGADPTGLATWGPYWQANGEDVLRTQIVGSQEYRQQAINQFG